MLSGATSAGGASCKLTGSVSDASPTSEIDIRITGSDVAIDDDTPPVPGPVLYLRLLSIMGGTDVKRGPKLSRAERKARREQRRIERRGHS